MEKLDLLLAGHITRDRILVGEEEVRSTGGAVYYGAFPAALFGIRVGVLTKIASEDIGILEEFHQAGIAVHPLRSRATTRIKTVPKSADFEKRTFTIEALADPFDVEDFSGVEARILALVPLMKGEMPTGVFAHLAGRAELALDVQGFIRGRKGDTLESGDWNEKEAGLRHVTYLKTDKRETEILTGLDDMETAVVRLAELGPREVLCTHAGGVLLFADGKFASAAFDNRSNEGRTGRGDTTFATYLAKRLSSGPADALHWAAALVSRKLERRGPFRGPLEDVGR